MLLLIAFLLLLLVLASEGARVLLFGALVACTWIAVVAAGAVIALAALVAIFG
jgi:hypothetical protein